MGKAKTLLKKKHHWVDLDDRALIRNSLLISLALFVYQLFTSGLGIPSFERQPYMAWGTLIGTILPYLIIAFIIFLIGKAWRKYTQR
jgi:large-conductance mechanosensitive channel